jgi:predicted small integral membrane protein
MLYWLSEHFYWMYWTWPSGIFFIALFAAIAAMGVWDVYQPTINRKGFLPIATSRGDRFFIGIISMIAIFLIWLVIFGQNYLWGALTLSVVWWAIEAKWG